MLELICLKHISSTLDQTLTYQRNYTRHSLNLNEWFFIYYTVEDLSTSIWQVWSILFENVKWIWSRFGFTALDTIDRKSLVCLPNGTLVISYENLPLVCLSWWKRNYLDDLKIHFFVLLIIAVNVVLGMERD